MEKTKSKNLKTLKDIGFAFDKNGKTDAIIISKEELKQEAIKWVKHFGATYPLSAQAHDGVAYGGILAFMKFFNLTEADLK